MTGAAPGWLVPTLPSARRAHALLGALSDEQKIALAIGNTSSPLLAGLGIPRQICSDGPAGVRGADDVTVFPVPIALAAGFDPQLAYEFGVAIAREVRAVGRTTWLGPSVDIVRDPLAGRRAEALGEDPFLAARVAEAEVLGARREHVLTMVKHFTAYNQEAWRIGHATGASPRARDDAIDVAVSERALREIYFPPVAAAVAAGAGAVMGSYNRVNGEYPRSIRATSGGSYVVQQRRIVNIRAHEPGVAGDDYLAGNMRDSPRSWKRG